MKAWDDRARCELTMRFWMASSIFWIVSVGPLDWIDGLPKKKEDGFCGLERHLYC
jgi:hypothetical protein